MWFSTMYTLEARVFATSLDPAAELEELFASIETNGHMAHMRIAAVLATT